jgi:putative ABC transport system permease protein
MSRTKFGTKVFIAFRHLRSRPFQTFSVVVLIAFSVGLSVALFSLTQGLQSGLVRATEPFDLIVGEKGSPYQLVLNAVFLQDTPMGNISWQSYLELSDDQRVDFAVPLAFGDSWRNYRVVGATSDIARITVGRSRMPWLAVETGRWFQNSFEAVLGAQAAQESGIGVGDTFRTAHGVVIAEGEDEHEHLYRVVGVAKRTYGPYDRAVLVDIRDIWEAHEHHEEEHPRTRPEEGGVTALLVRPNSYRDAYSLAASFQSSQEGSGKQLVFPAQTIVRLFSMIGRGERFLSLVVYAVAGCALLTTLMALYWSGSARRREHRLLHVLGLPRGALVFISWLEGTVPLTAGVLLGELLGRLGAAAAFYALNDATAVQSEVQLSIREFIVPLALLVAGSLGSLATAWHNERAR